MTTNEEKIEKVPYEEALKLLFMWIKQEHVGFREFMKLNEIASRKKVLGDIEREKREFGLDSMN